VYLDTGWFAIDLCSYLGGLHRRARGSDFLWMLLLLSLDLSAACAHISLLYKLSRYMKKRPMPNIAKHEGVKLSEKLLFSIFVLTTSRNEIFSISIRKRPGSKQNILASSTIDNLKQKNFRKKV